MNLQVILQQIPNVEEGRKWGSYIPREMKFSLVLNSVNMHSLVLKTFTMIIPPKYMHKTPSIIIERTTLSGQACGVNRVAELWRLAGPILSHPTGGTTLPF